MSNLTLLSQYYSALLRNESNEDNIDILKYYLADKFTDNMVELGKRVEEFDKQEKELLFKTNGLTEVREGYYLGDHEYKENTCLMTAVQKIAERAEVKLSIQQLGDYFRIKMGTITINGKDYVRWHDNSQFSPSVLREILDDLKISGRIKLMVFCNYENNYHHIQSERKDWTFLCSSDGSMRDLGIITLVCSGKPVKDISEINAGGHYVAWVASDIDIFKNIFKDIYVGNISDDTLARCGITRLEDRTWVNTIPTEKLLDLGVSQAEIDDQANLLLAYQLQQQ